MAASDKNIVISPQRGSATLQPTIVFTGDGNDPITLRVLDSATGALSFEGSAGQLLGISDVLNTGSIFSANYASGIPAIDVNANGVVSLVPTVGKVGIGTTNPITSLDLRSSSNEAMYIRRSDNASAYGILGVSGSNIFRLGSYVTGTGWGDISFNDAIRLTSTGNVGIGVTAPSAPLSFAGSTGRKIGFYEGTGGYSIGVESSEFRFVTDASGIFTFRNGGTYSSATEYVRIDSSGNVGIGTTNTSYKLHVVGDINFTGSLYQNGSVFTSGGGSGTELWTAGTGDNIYRSSGNVGIGTTNPTSGLQVKKSGTLFFQDSVWMQPAGNTLITAIGSSGQDNWIGLPGYYYATTGSANILLQANFGDLGSHAGHYISSTATGVGASYLSIGRILASGDTGTPAVKEPQLNISSGGNVGIGTTSPSENLHVHAPGSDLAAIVLSGTAQSQVPYRLMQGITGVSNAGFSIYDLTATATRLAIDSTGNVGIGIANPGNRLHVYGTSTVAKFETNNSYVDIQLVNTASSAGFIQYSGSDLNFFAASSSVPTLVVKGGSPGNVGIGTTNPQKPLEVIVSASNYASVGVASLGETQWCGVHFGYRENNTAYRKSVLAFERIDSAARGKIHILNNNEGNSNSATLSDSRLTIQSDGNVGIGTTNPGVKLDVAGSIVSSGSVSAAGASGFYSTTYIVNTRNPIWRFANAHEYGLSYFQGSAGVSPSGGGDTIGFHFGTPTAAASLLQLNNNSGAVINGTLGVTGEISGSSIVRTNSNKLVFRDDSIENHASDDDGAAIVLNYVGYNAGTSRFRDLYVYNGKAGLILRAVGSTGNVGIGTNNPVAKLHVAGNIYSTGVIDASSFQDTNNGDYFLNPASTTTSLQIAGAIEQGNNFAHPNIEWSYASASTGRVVFKLPGNTGNYGMVHMVFDYYEYNSPRTATIIVSGHNWDGAWYNTACNVVGYIDKPVYLGTIDGQYCVAFGDFGSTWNYATIRLRKIHNASFYNNIMDLGGTYTATQITSGTFTNISSDLRRLMTSNAMYAYEYRGHSNVAGTGEATYHPAGVYSTGTNWLYGSIITNNNSINAGSASVTASVFYDSDNTTYRFDGTGTTRLNTLRVYSNPSADWDAIEISTDGQSGYINSLGDEIGLRIRSEYGNILLADNRGRVGIANTAPLQALDVRGNFLLAADSTTSTHITQKPYTINGGTLSWEGSAGQLFSITNNLTTGSIFSVNDVSGIPSIDVDANGTIELAPFGGNVGIGTTNPEQKLHVQGSIRAQVTGGGTGILLHSNTGWSAASNLAQFWTGQTEGFAFYANDSGNGANERLRITASGNVGIGTTNPSTRLHLHTAAGWGGNITGSTLIRLESTDAVGPAIAFKNSSGSYWNIYHGSTSSFVGNNNLGFMYTDGINEGGINNVRVTFASNGNVGIGTTNPGTPLDVRGTDSLIRASETGSGSAWRARIISHNPDAAVNRAAFLGVYGTSAGVFAHNAALNGWAPLFVNTTDGGSDGSTVLLAGSGTVGIGTNNPLAKLHVNATGRAATIGGAPGGNPAGTVATQTSYLELVAGSGGNTNSSAVVFHNPGVSTAALEYLNADANTGYFNFKSDDAYWRVGIGTTSPRGILSLGDSVVDNKLYVYDSPTDKYGFGIRNSQFLIYSGSAGDATGGLLFGKYDGSTFSENVRFTNNGNVGIGLTNPAYKLEVSGRSNFNDNMKITPTSESWAEGLQFYMPNTSTWGGVRWVRNRSNFHGSWYQGWTALDSSNDMVFGHNASGTQVDNILRLYGSASGSARIGRDLYISGITGGNYGNRLVVGNTDTSYTAQDGNLRPTIQAHGAYPVLSLNHTITGNTSHGPTIQFTCNGTGHQFVIGTTGNGSRMDIGFSSTGDWNPHNGISNYQGTTSMSFTTSGNIGIGTTNPSGKLEVTGGWTYLESIWSKGQNAIYLNDGNWSIGYSINGLLIQTTSSHDVRINSNKFVFSGYGSGEKFRIANNGAIGLSGENYGAAGQVLTSNGSGAAPTWQNGGGGSGAVDVLEVMLFG